MTTSLSSAAGVYAGASLHPPAAGASTGARAAALHSFGGPASTPAHFSFRGRRLLHRRPGRTRRLGRESRIPMEPSGRDDSAACPPSSPIFTTTLLTFHSCPHWPLRGRPPLIWPLLRASSTSPPNLHPSSTFPHYSSQIMSFTETLQKGIGPEILQEFLSSHFLL